MDFNTDALFPPGPTTDPIGPRAGLDIVDIVYQTKKYE